MCIVLLSTAHPDYPFILVSNRDEFLNRPTAAASFWPSPDSHVLGGRDLQRPEQGTWLGITRQGRLAAITNVREETEPPSNGSPAVSGTRSRGAIANAWLKLPPDSRTTTDEFLAELSSDNALQHDVGGFSLLCGQLKKPTTGDNGVAASLAFFSNRSPPASQAVPIPGSATTIYGLSNSSTNQVWPKVEQGKKLLEHAIQGSLAAGDSQEKLVTRLFQVLDIDQLPQRQKDEPLEAYLHHCRSSIYIRRLPVPADWSTGNGSSHSIEAKTSTLPDAKPDQAAAANSTVYYGTQKQTVLLVSRQGHVTFVERTPYDDHYLRVPTGHGDRRFDFDLQEWGEEART